MGNPSHSLAYIVYAHFVIPVSRKK